MPGIGLDFSFTKDPRISADVSFSSSSLSTWEETPNHHRVRTALEFITLQTRKNVSPNLETIKTFIRDCIRTLVNDQGNASIVHLSKQTEV